MFLKTTYCSAAQHSFLYWTHTGHMCSSHSRSQDEPRKSILHCVTMTSKILWTTQGFMDLYDYSYFFHLLKLISHMQCQMQNFRVIRFRVNKVFICWLNIEFRIQTLFTSIYTLFPTAAQSFIVSVFHTDRPPDPMGRKQL